MPIASSTADRGYGRDHQVERQRWVTILAEVGELPCARCQEPIYQGDAWDLGHNEDRTAWTGPECLPCNRGAGAVNSNRGRQMIVRPWNP